MPVESSKVTAVILNYNSASNVKRLVQNLNSLQLSFLDIVVIDNESTDDSFSLLQDFQRNARFELIASGKNGGYAFGNNIGIHYAQGRASKYVLVMNGDIIFNHDFVTPLVHYLDQDMNAAICSPVLETTTGDKNYGKQINLGSLHYQQKLYPEDMNAPFKVQAIVGACFMVRMQAIKQVGDIPEPYFLNFEETEWCLQFGKAGYSIVCLPFVSVLHEVHGSINSVSGIQEYFVKRNLVLFNRRMCGTGRFLWFFMKLMMQSVYHGIKTRSLPIMRPYFDGLTGHNRFA